MKLIVEDQIADKFPELRIGIVVARGIMNRASLSDLQDLKTKAISSLRERYATESLLEHRNILSWRETYKEIGVNPKRSVPSAESFITRILKGSCFPTINSAVDLYLVVETEFLLSIGGYDLDKIQGDICLRFSKGREGFIPLGSSRKEYTKAGEVVYSDEAKILTRKWNFRDTESAKISSTTKNIALFIEAPVSNVATDDVCNSVSRLANYIERFCGGLIATHIINTKNKRALTL